jgi:anti-sigma regulatory factor (Ser/Thr protein kinase)
VLRRELLYDPGAVGEARAWVAEALVEWTEDGRSRAVLVTSELVANAIIHARTSVSVDLDIEGDCARVEVSDGSSEAPTTKRYGTDATTGRGLRLVGQLSEEWGARSVRGGKTVWAVIRDIPWEVTGPLGTPEMEIEPVAPAVPAATAVPVRLLDIPLAVLIDAQQHNDALLRELVFVAGSGHLSARLDALARDVTEHLASAGDVGGVIEAAVAERQHELDLTVSLGPAGWQSILELSSLLDEADLYCERMELLTLASPPAVKRFRQWYRDQVQAQIQGHPPTPWSDEDEPGGGPPVE